MSEDTSKKTPAGAPPKKLFLRKDTLRVRVGGDAPGMRAAEVPTMGPPCERLADEEDEIIFGRS